MLNMQEHIHDAEQHIHDAEQHIHDAEQHIHDVSNIIGFNLVYSINLVFNGELSIRRISSVVYFRSCALALFVSGSSPVTCFSFMLFFFFLTHEYFFFLIFLYFFSILKGLFSLTGTVATSPNLAKARARRASKAERLSVCAMLLFSSVMYMLFSVVYMLFSVVYMLLHIVQSLTLYGIRTINAYRLFECRIYQQGINLQCIFIKYISKG